MKKIIVVLMALMLCMMLLVSCASPKVTVKDDEGNVEISVDGDAKDDKVDIEVKTEDGDSLSISAEQEGDWPTSELPDGFPELRSGSISGSMVSNNGGIKNTMIIMADVDEEKITKYATSFSEAGYTEIMKSANDGFMWVQQKDKCTVTVAFVKSSGGATITVQVE